MTALQAAARYMDSEHDKLSPKTPKKKRWDRRSKVNLPPPLVSPLKHPVTFLKHKAALLGTAAVLTYIGILIVAALYYILFEVWAPATEAWHNVGPDVFGMTEAAWKSLRHNIRDVGEGLLGGLLAQMIIWNAYKKSVNKKPNWLDKIEIALHIPNVKDDRSLSGWQMLAAVPLVLIYAVPGFLVAEWIVNAVHPYVAMSTGTSLWDRVSSVVTENYPKKLIGFGAAFFFGRRPAKGIFDDLQLWFAERRVGHGKSCRWYHMPTFKARCNDISDKTIILLGNEKDAATMTMRALVPIGLGLAVFGFYVLNFIAK